MTSLFIRNLNMRTQIERWPFKAPFRITGYVWEFIEVLLVQLEANGAVGQGEAAGVYYKDESPAVMLRQLEGSRTIVEAGLSRDSLQSLLPAGGARNALDCALWDLEAKLTGRSAWDLAGVGAPRQLLTNFGCGADTPEAMAATARQYDEAKALKLKLTGEPVDVERVLAVRDARPDVRLGVDANQGFSRAFLERVMPTFVEAHVELIEQPFPVGQENLLDGLHSPIPIAADESLQTCADLPSLMGRFQVANIKLDKAGGLTEGLRMARKARELGLDTMVGGMFGTSLAIAPAALLGQLCSVVDLDAPMFLERDRGPAVDYSGGLLWCPKGLWGR